MLNELKKILGELYAEYGATESIVRLSQAIDELVYQEMLNRG